MTTWEYRAAQNEVLFREVNEQVAHLEERFGELELATFLCECADESCMAKLQVPLPLYEEVRADSRRFMVKPGHEVAAIERVVGEHSGFLIVEKRDGTSREVAERTDPRSP